LLNHAKGCKVVGKLKRPDADKTSKSRTQVLNRKIIALAIPKIRNIQREFQRVKNIKAKESPIFSFKGTLLCSSRGNGIAA
jgi:hypothetical protein